MLASVTGSAAARLRTRAGTSKLRVLFYLSWRLLSGLRGDTDYVIDFIGKCHYISS
jgi:hypothetical protein